MRPQMIDFMREAAPTECNSGDCLPPHALVWAEGKSFPTKVCDVVAGERVLCHDELSGGIKYAEVVSASTAEAVASDWVVVTLEDGTALEMTTEHPVFPGLVGGDGVGHAVRAA